MTNAIRVVFVLAALAVSLLRAQDEEKWYFAQNLTSGQVVAYTADGETHVLLEGTEGQSYGWRLEADSALEIVTVNGAVNVYHLTPDEAQPLATPFDMAEADITPSSLQAYHAPYVLLLAAPEVPSTTAMLANLSENTLDVLGDTEILYSSDIYRFSADGQDLRFVRSESAESDNWTLVERKLATGEERTIYTIQNDFYPVVTADQYGERWLYIQPNPETQANDIILITNDGSIEVIGETSRNNPVALRLFDNQLFAFPLTCESDCTVELRPLDGEDTVTFALPTIEGMVQPLYQPDDAHLLIFDTDARAFWILSAEEPPVQIGYWLPVNVSTPLDRVLSPDGRWLFVTEQTGNSYGVWDMANGEFVMQNEIEASGIPFYWVIYSDGGFLVNESYQRQFLYAYDDEIATQLPNGDQGYYFQVLPDGTMLYVQLEENEDRAPGIHRYDHETGIYTLLVEDALPACVVC